MALEVKCDRCKKCVRGYDDPDATKGPAYVLSLKPQHVAFNKLNPFPSDHPSNHRYLICDPCTTLIIKSLYEGT